MGDRHRPPIAGYCAMLSDWEVHEARRDNLAGIPVEVLAERYGVSGRTLRRAFKKMNEKGVMIA